MGTIGFLATSRLTGKAARNATTRLVGMIIRSPLNGLRPDRLFLISVQKCPKFTSLIAPPIIKCWVIIFKKVLIISSVWLLVQPAFSATKATSSVLFKGFSRFIGGKISVINNSSSCRSVLIAANFGFKRKRTKYAAAKSQHGVDRR